MTGEVLKKIRKVKEEQDALIMSIYNEIWNDVLELFNCDEIIEGQISICLEDYTVDESNLDYIDGCNSYTESRIRYLLLEDSFYAYDGEVPGKTIFKISIEDIFEHLESEEYKKDADCLTGLKLNRQRGI